MLFNSLEFLLLFLPITMLGFAFATRQQSGGTAAVCWLIALSLFFYGYWDWTFLILLVGSTIFNFWIGLKIAQYKRRIILIVGIVVNLGLLGWFKYGMFIAGNLSTILGLNINIPDIVLPLSISFFTFHQIAYLVDVWRGDKPEHNLLYFALFIFFFPHLIAGPVLRHWELLPQFRKPEFRFNGENIAIGLAFLSIGLFKKVVLSNAVQGYSDRVFDIAALGETVTFIPSWVAIISFSLQIYFDFSGYSDMAIGLARMCGVRLPINFNSPYKSTSIIEFWRRWHITLSRFLKDYLYIPLGGNQYGEWRRHANLLIVMLLGGVWHGAAWTFVQWGASHGLALIINHLWQGSGKKTQLSFSGRFVGWVLTMLVVLVAWVAFRAPNWLAAVTLWSGMFGLNGIFLPESYADSLGSLLQIIGVSFNTSPDIIIYPNRSELGMIFALIACVVILPNSQEINAKFNPVFESIKQSTGLSHLLSWRYNVLTGICAGALLALLMAIILQSPGNAFIYFQF